MNNIYSSAFFNPDTFTHISAASGKRTESLRGQYDLEDQLVIIRDTSIRIEIGDTLIQNLPHDGKKSMTVADITSYDEGPLGKSWYEISVKSQTMTHVNYAVNNYGTIGQLAQGGNINVSNKRDELFIAVTKILLENQKQISDIPVVLNLLRLLTTKSECTGKTTMLERVSKFMELTANISTTLAPFLPQILQLWK